MRLVSSQLQSRAPWKALTGKEVHCLQRQGNTASTSAVAKAGRHHILLNQKDKKAPFSFLVKHLFNAEPQSFKCPCSQKSPHCQTVQAVSTSHKPRFKALTVDIGGTFLKTAEPVPEAYARIGQKYGVSTTPDQIKQGFKAAFAKPWPERLRYEGDGRPFWRHAVATATGCSDLDYFEELYLHYSHGDAWKVEEGAEEALARLRAKGVKLAVVSNFDTRLRPVLADLGVSNLFDAIIVSAEVGHEKPDIEIFQAALRSLQISNPEEAAHIGDDYAADVEGAKAAGMQAWLWKKDIKTFDELAKLIL